MKALLICPDRRHAVSALAQDLPLSNLPLLGKTVIEYWLEHVAGLGAKTVRVLAADRPEQVHAIVDGGVRWGLRAEVVPELRELTPVEARAIYNVREGDGWLPGPQAVALLDRLPALPAIPLFSSYAGWFAAARAWLPRAATPDRIGIREIAPGVWRGLRAHVAPDAELRAPCWIGDHAHVSSGAIIGPETVLEAGAFVESGAEVTRSIVGPETCVGKLTEVRKSIAMGRTLVNWETNSSTTVADKCLLCSLEKPRAQLARATPGCFDVQTIPVPWKFNVTTGP